VKYHSFAYLLIVHLTVTSELVQELMDHFSIISLSFSGFPSHSYHHLFISSLVLLTVLLPTDSRAGDGYYLNPGLRFGHTFGQTGGFTVGFEISYTKFESDGLAYGALASIDYCRNAGRLRYHVAAEYLAVAAGPTLIAEGGKLDLGIDITPYVGAVVIPYFNYTYRFAGDDLMEAGGFLKFPILVAGTGFKIGH